MDDLGQGQGQRGRGSRDTEILESIADRLVEVHGEDPNTDYIINLRRIAAKYGTLQDRPQRPKDRIEQKLDEIMDAVTRVHVITMIDAAVSNGITIPEEKLQQLREIVDSFDQ